MSSKSRLFVGAAVVAILAGGVVIGSQYYPPKPGHTEGTVAPMGRYHNGQVQSGDVATGDTSVANMMWWRSNPPRKPLTRKNQD